MERVGRDDHAVKVESFQHGEEFRDLDAELRFNVQAIDTMEPAVCIAGQILQGIKKPHDCPAFGTACTPQHPLGATMVSAEGACAAYYAYGRHLKDADPAMIGANGNGRD